jgi:hypothetical protein
LAHRSAKHPAIRQTEDNTSPVASSNDLPTPREELLATRRAAEQDVLLREVDEAVRQDELSLWLQRYGKLAAVVAVLGLAAFAGILFWREHSDSQREQRSEQLITAFDAMGGGRIDEAKRTLPPLVSQSGPAGAASARLALAAIALRENRATDAYKQYEALISDGATPKPYRDFATLRLVAARFEELKPDEVVARLKPLAKPGNAWFGSAGELLAMAYLKQGRNDDAGKLLSHVAQDNTVPVTLRSRTRQLAGLLGYDAVTDVSQTLKQLESESGPAPAPAAAPEAAASAAAK